MFCENGVRPLRLMCELPCVELRRAVSRSADLHSGTSGGLFHFKVIDESLLAYKPAPVMMHQNRSPARRLNGCLPKLLLCRLSRRTCELTSTKRRV